MASDSENPLVIKTAASFRDLRMYEPSSYERAYAPRPIPSGSNPTLFESLGTERGDKCLQLRRRRSCGRVQSEWISDLGNLVRRAVGDCRSAEEFRMSGMRA